MSPVGIDCVSVSLVNSDDNDQTNMAMELSRFQPLNHPHSPVDVSGDSQVVAESPSTYEAPAVPPQQRAACVSVAGRATRLGCLIFDGLVPGRAL